MARRRTAGPATGFRAWRRSRPFWAGVFTIAGGFEIMVLPLTPIASLVLLGVAGVSSLLTGVVMAVLGLFMWLSPPNRTLAGVLTLIFALASFIISNLGGLIVGMVLGIIGGALCLAWTPTSRSGGGRRRLGRRAEPVTQPVAAGPGADDPDTEDYAPGTFGSGEFVLGPDPDPDEPHPGSPPVERRRPSPAPRPVDGSGGPQFGSLIRRRASRTAVVLGFAITAVLGPGVAPALAAPADTCLLGLLCPPGGDSPAPTTSPAAPSRPPPTSAPAPTLTPSPQAVAPAPGAAPTPTPAPLIPGLPLPNPLPGVLPTLPLPDVTAPGGLLPGLTELLPSGLITPLLPQLAAEPGIEVSGRIGTLTMDTLSVTNFQFLGVVEHRTPNGTIKALRIVVDSADMGNLGVVMPGPAASVLVNQLPGAPHASTGRLTLDIQKISLTLFGVLPIEFSFALPPPPLIVLPVLSATNVNISFVAVQSNLNGPNLDIRLGPGSTGPGSNTATGPAPPAATLVSLASLLKLPGLLVPYGLTPQQAATVVQNHDAGRDLTTPAPAAPPAASPLTQALAGTGLPAAAGADPEAPAPAAAASPTTAPKPPPKLLGILPLGP
ncbi:DUF6114 domain-containing protein [Pseudonocardia sp. GCM10023141]|uniref:DUF6114 domain-containing protein n=1 Tax=Pseudonocardia sp. GCM10023141 TaxID=3252653 RepID=UPI00360DF4C5